MVRLKSSNNEKNPSLSGPGSPTYSHTSASYLTTGFPPPMAQPLSPQIGGSTVLVSSIPANTSNRDDTSNVAQEVPNNNAPSLLNQPSIQPFHPSARSVEFDPYKNSPPE
jgi:hypothetical protein